jgi:hypothetical protein
MYDIHTMPKRSSPSPRSVREPVQVYLETDDSALLARVAASAGLSKAEVMRRGMRAFARELDLESPMLRFVTESGAGEWPTGVAADHDSVLAESYMGPRAKRR